ncbi:MAG: pantetheine-phosphate adenylyltransferase [Candidatus Cloacimonetes bacterium]|nr:pantetheine-phosphate adenylyltransferase [Candidatus Cloacimonadota bacterium]
MKNIAIYPGSFDPITNGHIDILKKATELFDTVILAVAEATTKDHLFDGAERERLCRESTKYLQRVEVTKFDGLIVDYARKVGAKAMIRGLRAVSDFEYELQLALMNKHLDSKINTVFLIPDYKYFYLSSSLIRQVVSLGGDVSVFIPTCVENALKERLLGTEN